MSRLALFVPELECGGAQRLFLRLAGDFVRRGHRTDLVLALKRGALLDQVPSAVQLVDLGATAGGPAGQLRLAVSSLRRLRTYLERERPVALLSTLTGANLVAVIAGRRPGTSTRIVLREAVSLRNRRNPLWAALMRRLYPRADRVVTLSESLEGELVETLGIPRNKIRCIPNPTDVAHVRERAAAPLDHPWFQNRKHRVVISVGRLVPQKDHQTLLRAFARLPADPMARLVILGDGPERDALERTARALGISDRVLIAGFDPNPWRWMARADLFVLSSRWEGHPHALLEALSLRIPVVATEYDTSLRRMAAHYGFLTAPAGEPEALAMAMAQRLRGDAPIQRLPMDDFQATAQRYLEVLGCG